MPKQIPNETSNSNWTWTIGIGHLINGKCRPIRHTLASLLIEFPKERVISDDEDSSKEEVSSNGYSSYSTDSDDDE